MTMLLEYTDKTNSVTDTELLLDLQRVSNETGKQSLTIAEYKEHGRYEIGRASCRERVCLYV